MHKIPTIKRDNTWFPLARSSMTGFRFITSIIHATQQTYVVDGVFPVESKHDISLLPMLPTRWEFVSKIHSDTAVDWMNYEFFMVPPVSTCHLSFYHGSAKIDSKRGDMP